MEKPHHPAFPQPLDKNISIWRYFELWKFIDLLNTRQLFLSRVDKLNDPHEGSITQPQRDALFMQYFHAASTYGRNILDSLSPERQSDYRRMLKDRTYVSCWHMNESESEAMWRLYCGAEEGVAIRTTYEKLRISLSGQEMYIGLVSYKDYEKEGYPLIQIDPEWPPEDVDYYPFMHKRKAFEHEREVRVIKKVDATVNGESAEGVRLAWNDLENLIERIYVNPYAGAGYFDAVKVVVIKFAPQLEGVLRWSAMKREPLY